MKKILLSIATVALVGAVVAGATGAWFTNVETSTGNTFTAGVIDLKIDNESYVTNNDGVLVASPETSWQIKDLNGGELFFNFNDLKPGDVGEDTISIHVGSNDAWACMDINVTATPENNPQTEPEALVDDTDGDNEGELQDELEFVFWKDDGDNVLETDEEKGIFWNDTIQGISDGGTLTLADSLGGVLENGLPLIGEKDYFIGKAWCQGELTLTPVDDDNVGGPLERGTGISCNGYPITDASQTDGVLVDVSFSAEQSRHNDNFLCNPPQEGQLTVVKEVIGGDMTVDQFVLYVDGSQVNNGEVNTYPSGPHTVSEGDYPDYVASYSPECTDGDVIVPVDENVTCTITNTFTKGTLTVTKIVEGGPLTADEFVLLVDGSQVGNGVTNTFPEGGHVVSENDYPDYTTVIGGADCDSGGNVTVTANDSASCTITNTYTLGTLTVNKVVEGTMGNDNDLDAGDFSLFVDDEPVVNGVAESFPAGVSLNVNEDGDSRYTASYSGACDENGNVTLAVGVPATCTITNTYNRATLTVDKRITFSNQAVDVEINDFTLTISGPSGVIDVTDEVPEIDLIPGTYTVTEVKIGGAGTIADAEFDIDCTDLGTYGEVVLAAGDDLTCRITNEIAPNA